MFHAQFVPFVAGLVEVRCRGLRQSDRKTYGFTRIAARTLDDFRYGLHCVSYDIKILGLDWLLEAVYPCTERGDDFASFGLGEFGAPFRDVGELIDPNRKGCSVVFSFQTPFVRKAGSGFGRWFGGGTGEL